MGDAKRREVVRKQLEQAVVRVGTALAKLHTATSSKLGSDCYTHLEIGRILLQDLGIETRGVVGYAAWRVGLGDSDILSHTAEGMVHFPPGAKGFPYHAWLETSDFLIDFTTYQLPEKARKLDEADGGMTNVTWAPKVLLIPRSQVKTFNEVRQSYETGVVYYEAKPEFWTLLRDQFTLDPVDLANARLVFNNPHATVFGPNDFKLAQD